MNGGVHPTRPVPAAPRRQLTRHGTSSDATLERGQRSSPAARVLEAAESRLVERLEQEAVSLSLASIPDHTPLLRLTQVLAALAVVSAGCGGEGPQIKSNPKETQPHRVLRIVGGAAAQRTLLRGIVDAVGPSSLDTIVIGFTKSAKGAWDSAPCGSQALVFEGPRPSTRARWERHLIAGVFRDRSRELGVPPLIAIESAEACARIGPVHPMNKETTPDPPKAGSSDVEALGEKLADEASEADATLRASEVFVPYGAAASVRLEVRDPPEFLRRRLSRFLDAFENGSYEGLYVEATTPDGSIVWKGAFASRLGAGSSWVRPDLAGCYLGTFSLERDTPPCPAR